MQKNGVTGSPLQSGQARLSVQHATWSTTTIVMSVRRDVQEGSCKVLVLPLFALILTSPVGRYNELTHVLF